MCGHSVPPDRQLMRTCSMMRQEGRTPGEESLVGALLPTWVSIESQGEGPMQASSMG